jgi:hypothetical protein
MDMLKDYLNLKVNIYSFTYQNSKWDAYSFSYVPTFLGYYANFSFLPYSLYNIDILKGHILFEKLLDELEIDRKWIESSNDFNTRILDYYDGVIWVDKQLKSMESGKIFAGNKEKLIQSLYINFLHKVVYAQNSNLLETDKKKQTTLPRQEILFHNPTLEIKNRRALDKYTVLEKELSLHTIKDLNTLFKTMLLSGKIDLETILQLVHIFTMPNFLKSDIKGYIKVLSNYVDRVYSNDVMIVGLNNIEKVYTEFSMYKSLLATRLFSSTCEILTNGLLEMVRTDLKVINTHRILKSERLSNMFIAFFRNFELQKELDIDVVKMSHLFDKSLIVTHLEKLTNTFSDKLNKELMDGINSAKDPDFVLIDKIGKYLQINKNVSVIKNESDLNLLAMYVLDNKLHELAIGDFINILEKEFIDSRNEFEFTYIDRSQEDRLVYIVDPKRLERLDYEAILKYDDRYLKDTYRFIDILIDNHKMFRLPLLDIKILESKSFKKIKEILPLLLRYGLVKEIRDSLIESNPEFSEKLELDSTIVIYEILGDNDKILKIDLSKFIESTKTRKEMDLGIDFNVLDMFKDLKQVLIEEFIYLDSKTDKIASIIPEIFRLIKDDKDKSIFTIIHDLLLEKDGKALNILEDLIVDKEKFVTLFEQFDVDKFKDIDLTDLIEFIKNSKVSIVFDKKDFEKDLKDIFIQLAFVLNEFYLRWELIDGEKGPWDDLLIPDEDWDYQLNPLNGINQDPFVGKDKGKKHVILSVYVIKNVIDFMKAIFQANVTGYAGSTPSTALKHFITSLYDWISQNEEMIEGSNREDYWRVFRLVRWYSEGILHNVEELDNNRPIGAKYVDKLIKEVTKYFIDHHSNAMLDVDKFKGSRRRDLSRSRLLKKEDFGFKGPTRPN